jgi:hypothetical protein
MVLGHPNKPADVALWGIPIDCLGEMRMPSPNWGSQLVFLDVVDQQSEEWNFPHIPFDEMSPLRFLHLP